MSIIRVGLAETKNFSDGYDRIFGKKQEEKPATEQPKGEEARAETPKQEEKK